MNNQFKNDRTATNLRRYYLRILIKFDIDDLEKKSNIFWSESSCKVLLKANELYVLEDGRTDYDRIKQLFPNNKPSQLFQKLKRLLNEKKIQLDPNEKIDLVVQDHFHFNALGDIKLRPIRDDINKAVDNGEALNDISERLEINRKLVKKKYNYQNSPLALNNKCPFLCPVKIKKSLCDHITEYHTLESKLPEIVNFFIKSLSSNSVFFKDLNSIIRKSKNLVELISKDKMIKRNEDRKFRSYCLVKKFDTTNLNDIQIVKHLFNSQMYFGQTEFDHRPQESFVSAILFEQLNLESFKDQMLLEGEWMFMWLDRELNENGSILLEHIGINLELKNVLNINRTADQSLFISLSKEDSFELSIYVLLRMYSNFKEKNFQNVNIEELRERSKRMVLAVKSLNKSFKNRTEV